MVKSLSLQSKTSFGAGGYVPQVDFLSREEEYDLWRRFANHNDMDARATFLKAYLPLCQSLAWEQLKQQNGSMDIFHDLFGEAQAEMVELFDKKTFDPGMGNRFSTFVMPWIRNRLITFIMDNKAPFRMCTTNLHRKIFNNYGRLAIKAEHENPGMTTHQRHKAIAALLGVFRDKKVEPADIAEFEMKSSSIFISGSSSAFDDDDDGIESLISRTASDFAPPESQLEDEDMARTEQILFSALGTLNERARNIIEQRFLVPEPCTLKDLAIIYGVSVERVRQIESTSLKKLQKIMTDTELAARPPVQRTPTPA